MIEKWIFVFTSLVIVMGVSPASSSDSWTARGQFSFSMTVDMREFAGAGVYDTPQYFRGACEAINLLGPGDFMISPGDLDPPAGVRYSLDTYIGPGYLWYPVAGNHETETPADMVWLRNYNVGGNTLPYIVNMGPVGCVETMYSYDFDNTHFVVLNEYFDGISDVATAGDISDPVYFWLAEDLAATDKTHIFVIGHEPAYPQPDADNGRIRHLGDSLDQYPENRDRFWTLLHDMNVLAYLTGHSHNYSLVDIGGVWQIDVGHARGLGDTGARSTFVMIDIDNEIVTYDTYRDDAAGGEYSLMHTGYLTGGPTPTPTPYCDMQTLVDPGDTWLYLDDGTDPGPGWYDPAFDDSGWQSGPAQLGYGDGDELTVVSYGTDPDHKYITTYFHHWFEVTKTTEINSMILDLLRDDGAVVYLNGVELFRTNMQNGTVTYTTLALSTIGGAAESAWQPFSVDPGLLVDGWNLLAIEIHQISGTSSDISMDARLAGCRLIPVTPTPTPECLHHGDVDLNGSITAGDAQLAFRIVLDLYSPSDQEWCAADCNNDGDVTTADAQTIFSAAMALDTCEDLMNGIRISGQALHRDRY